jgi:hypothetical protein
MFGLREIERMNESRPKVPCGCCGGTGRVPLGIQQGKTLDLLRKQTELMNGAQLAKLAKCSNEAMCNRLVQLEEYGLAKSARYGRERLWEAVR